MTLFPPMTDAHREALLQQEARRREFAAMQTDHVCRECASLLGAWTWQWGRDREPLLACMANPAEHRGFRRLPSLTQRYDRGETLPLSIVNAIEKRRRDEVTQDLAIPVRQELAKYQGKRALTQQEAEHILEAIWPGADREEKVRAAMLCESYRLNPLMKHVFLIPFNKKDKDGNVVKTNWATVMGIDATRLLASRRAPYSVIDGPRVMTEDEQVRIFGEVDSGSVVCITVVADREGNRAPGYGKWSKVNRWGKPNQPEGVDKGNSMVNMAMIRSERNALKRLRPAEMPDVEVVDADYIVMPRMGDEVAQPPEAQLPEPEGMIDVDEDTGEVFGDPPAPSQPIDVTNSEPPMAPPVLKCVNDLTKAAHERYDLQPKEVYAILGRTSAVEIGDLEEAWAKIVASQDQNDE
jgi:hypothetical protein